MSSNEAPATASEQGPLHGIKVVDFSQNLPGPYTTLLMASMGAEVIKVEPLKGESGRFMEPFFSMVNQGKQSFAMDLKNAQDLEIARDLIRTCDVLIEGFRPGVMARLGLDYAGLAKLNPRLVYCSISAYGQTGPMKDTPGHDLNLQAESGLCAMEADLNSGEPQPLFLPVADLSASLAALSRICAALYQRSQTGNGSYLDVAMSDSLTNWVSLWHQGIDFRQQAEVTLSKKKWIPSVIKKRLVDYLGKAKLYALPHYGLFRCRDEQYIAVGIVDEDHFWQRFCEGIGLAKLGMMNLPWRLAGGQLVRPLVAQALSKKKRDEWLTIFQSSGVPVSAVNTPSSDGAFLPPKIFGATKLKKSPSIGQHNAPPRS